MRMFILEARTKSQDANKNFKTWKETWITQQQIPKQKSKKDRIYRRGPLLLLWYITALIASYRSFFFYPLLFISRCRHRSHSDLHESQSKHFVLLLLLSVKQTHSQLTVHGHMVLFSLRFFYLTRFTICFLSFSLSLSLRLFVQCSHTSHS